MDELEKLLILSTMEPELVSRLESELDAVIDEWLSARIQDADFPPEAWPYLGRNTSRLMAQAAVAVLNAVYNAEVELVREGWLDARGPGLPEQVWRHSGESRKE